MDGNSLTVVLYKVGQNLNRAYRTCEFFGVGKIQLYRCNANLTGNLFKAKNNVKLETIEAMPVGNNVAYFETNGKKLIQDVDFSQIDTVCIGGETHDFISARFKKNKKIKIPGVGKSSGLTVEAAIAIALFHINNSKK